MAKIGNHQVHRFGRVLQDFEGFFSRIGIQHFVPQPFKFSL